MIGNVNHCGTDGQFCRMPTNPDQSTEGAGHPGNRPSGRLECGVIRIALFSVEDELGEAAGDPLVANWDVEALEAEACGCEQHGAMNAAQMLRNKARWLKPLLDPGGSERKFYLWEVDGLDWPHLSVLSWMAQEDRKAMEVLSKKADNYVGQLALAQAENEAAASRLVAITKFTTQTIQATVERADAHVLQPAFERLVRGETMNHPLTMLRETALPHGSHRQASILL